MSRMPARAFILPVVLVVIGLLALTMAGFIFFIRAEVAGSLAAGAAQQARLAAESGLEEVVTTLRLHPHDATVWFDAPSRFKHKLIWSSGYNRQSDPVARTGTREVLQEEYSQPIPAWRFSVVGDSYQEAISSDQQRIRFGITPEAGKLNLNAATDEQITALLTPLLQDLEMENAPALIAALLDWRDTDDETRENGAESDYYNTLEPPYNAKNGPLDSVEELLLVKGFSAAVLYGEDVNRNGILDANEDDGEESFPEYDNRDGVLNRGIAPFLTVWTREPDTALDNRPRINLNLDAAAVTAAIQTYFTEDELAACQGAINYITGLKNRGFDFSQLGSPAELYRAGLTEEEGGGGPTELQDSPVTLDELPIILDRFSTRPLQQTQTQGLVGLINVDTAPARVLGVVPGMTPEAVEAILAVRPELTAQEARTPAWLLTREVMDVATFHAVAPYLTTKAYQFHVEVLGYADHLKVVGRWEWIIEMIGPLAQVRYSRDLSPLGLAWPVDDRELAGEGVTVQSRTR